jgi:uncharacterized SAM-binding protein YcdF (DUF218 family)
MQVLCSLPAGLFALACVGLLLAGRGRRRAGWTLVVAAAVLLVLACTPLVAAALLLPLEAPPWDGRAPGERAALVVLGADLELAAPEYGGPTLGALSLERVRYAARVARATDLPVLTSGGRLRRAARPVAELMREALEVEYGVPVRWVEASSGTTHENAVRSAELLRADGIQRVLLVTHAWHVPRARRCFEAEGLEVWPAPTGYHLRPRPDAGDFLPSAKALRLSSLALHEWLGRAWYLLRHRAAGEHAGRADHR